MAVDPTQVLYASTLNTFKNVLPNPTDSVSPPVESYGAFSFKVHRTSIALDYSDAATLLLQNYSTQSTRWHIGTAVELDLNANFRAQTRAIISGSTLHIDLYVVNNTGGALNSPSFTVDYEVRQFVTPWE